MYVYIHIHIYIYIYTSIYIYTYIYTSIYIYICTHTHTHTHTHRCIHIYRHIVVTLHAHLSQVHLPPPTMRKRGSTVIAVPAVASFAAELEAQTAEQICLRLNNCSWACEQLALLGDKLVAALPDVTALARTRVGGGGVESLVAAGVAQCERACVAIVSYLARKAVYYELEAAFLTRLYLPSALNQQVFIFIYIYIYIYICMCVYIYRSIYIDG